MLENIGDMDLSSDLMQITKGWGYSPKQKTHRRPGVWSEWLKNRTGNTQRKNPCTSDCCWDEPVKQDGQVGYRRHWVYVPKRVLPVVQQMIEQRQPPSMGWRRWQGRSGRSASSTQDVDQPDFCVCAGLLDSGPGVHAPETVLDPASPAPTGTAPGGSSIQAPGSGSGCAGVGHQGGDGLHPRPGDGETVAPELPPYPWPVLGGNC